MAEGKDAARPSGREKRRLYVIAFIIAFAVDFLLSFYRGEAYRPTMIGLAIMIASVVYFAYSWFRER